MKFFIDFLLGILCSYGLACLQYQRGIDYYCLQLDMQLHRHLVFGKKWKGEGVKSIDMKSAHLDILMTVTWDCFNIFKNPFWFSNFKHSSKFQTQNQSIKSSFSIKINLLKKGGITIWELFGNHLAAGVF